MFAASIHKIKIQLKIYFKKTKVYLPIRYILTKYFLEIDNRNIVKLIFGNSTPKILKGPFKDLSYLRVSTGSVLLPKIIGSYEEPISNIIEKIILDNKYKKIIDIGCAEGYYAIGLAKSLPECQITAIDTDSYALYLCKKLSKLNNAKNVIFVKEFTESIIKDSNSVNTLIICDIEGDELFVLNPNNYKFLLNCDLLIECHDFFKEGTTKSLLEFYEKTHQVEFILDYKTRINHYDIPAFNYSQNVNLFDEKRPDGMNWLYLIKNK
jgi:SAM-dependent methyltransferase